MIYILEQHRDIEETLLFIMLIHDIIHIRFSYSPSKDNKNIAGIIVVL
jgi:hypothetical protein